MVNKNIPQICVNQMAFMGERKDEEVVSVNDVSVNIKPYMFPPKSPYSYSTRILLDNMFFAQDEKVLEVGIGCGILSVFAAKQGAYVEGVDIMPECVEYATTNALVNGVEDRTKFYYSNMFSEVTGKYDKIICNLPILDGELPDNDPRWYSLFDPEFRFHHILFDEGRDYSSNILIAHADLTEGDDFGKLEKLAESYGWRVAHTESKIYSGKEWRSYEFRRDDDD